MTRVGAGSWGEDGKVTEVVVENRKRNVVMSGLGGIGSPIITGKAD